MKSWIRKTLVPLAIALPSSAGVARAEELPAAVAREINHLIDVVRTSPCIFIRNGVEYDGTAAIEHIQQKHQHYRDRIRSAEDFIDLAASRSMISGRPYAVRCQGQQVVPAAEWLRVELKDYQAKAGGD